MARSKTTEPRSAPAITAAPERLFALGVPVDAVGVAGAQHFVRAALADPWDGRCRHVVTLNPEYVMAARRDSTFAVAIAGGDLIVADGVGAALVGRWLGDGVGRGPHRVTGVDLAELLAARSGPDEAPLFLLGAGPGVVVAAAAALGRRFPGSRIAGYWGGGSPQPEDDASSLARIAASGARVVLVAYGAPGQVLWIERNRAALAAAGVRLAIGVGGAMDILAGRVPRAPAWMRRLGLEWLYRLGREPWRWRRQLALPRFALLAGLAWLWRRGNRARRWARPMTPSSGDVPRDRPAAREQPDADSPSPGSDRLAAPPATEGRTGPDDRDRTA